MATGDVTVFDEAKAYLLDGDFGSTDNVKLALLDNTTPPVASQASPALGTYTEMETAGTYPAGGDVLDTIANMVTEASGTMTFDDTGASVTWAQDPSNGTDAYWGLIYNDDDAGDLAIAFVELGGPVDMQAGDLTITWHASGIFTIT